MKQTVLFVDEKPQSKRKATRHRLEALPLHHFRCRRCGEWKVIESLGVVVGAVACPNCHGSMKHVELIQTELGLFEKKRRRIR